MSSSPGSPTGGGAAQYGRLRALLRKAFIDMECVLGDWEEASAQGAQVLHALVNAGERLRDFTAAEGKLGVLSHVPGAEDALRGRLIRSMERLHRALQPAMAALATACDKAEKIVDDAVHGALELQHGCEPDGLWEGEYPGQPSIAEMQEWLQDWQHALKRELGLRELLLRDAGSEEGLTRALDLWDARIMLDPERARARLEAVKVHVVGSMHPRAAFPA